MKGMDLLYVDSRETPNINVIPQVKNNLLPGVLFVAFLKYSFYNKYFPIDIDYQK